MNHNGENNVFDVIVIGGGVTGGGNSPRLCVAWNEGAAR